MNISSARQSFSRRKVPTRLAGLFLPALAILSAVSILAAIPASAVAGEAYYQPDDTAAYQAAQYGQPMPPPPQYSAPNPYARHRQLVAQLNYAEGQYNLARQAGNRQAAKHWKKQIKHLQRELSVGSLEQGPGYAAPAYIPSQQPSYAQSASAYAQPIPEGPVPSYSQPYPQASAPYGYATTPSYGYPNAPQAPYPPAGYPSAAYPNSGLSQHSGLSRRSCRFSIWRHCIGQFDGRFELATRSIIRNRVGPFGVGLSELGQWLFRQRFHHDGLDGGYRELVDGLDARFGIIPPVTMRAGSLFSHPERSEGTRAALRAFMVSD